MVGFVFFEHALEHAAKYGGADAGPVVAGALQQQGVQGAVEGGYAGALLKEVAVDVGEGLEGFV